MFQSIEKYLTSTRGRSCDLATIPWIVFSKPAAKFRQKVRRTFDPNSRTKITYDSKIIPAHVAIARDGYFDDFNHLASGVCSEAEQAVRIKAHSHRPVNAQKTAFPLWYTLPGTPSTPNSRPRQRCDQDGIRTNNPCQPKHLPGVHRARAIFAATSVTPRV